MCLFGDDGTVRAVSELQSVRRDFGRFPYFVSTIAASGGMNAHLERQITLALRGFGALKKAVFLDRNLRLETKRKIYQACVLSVLLYGSAPHSGGM